MTQDIEYKAGQVIFRQGYPADNAYIIKSGRVEVYKESTQGEEHVTFLGVGQMFGEYGVLDDAPRSASVRAVEDVVLQIVPL